MSERKNTPLADAEAAVAAGVAGQVDGLDGRAAEVEDVAVAEPVGVGARRVVELLDDVGGERVVERQAVHVHQTRRGCARRAGRRRGRAPGRRGTAPLPAMWSSWLWLLTTASTGDRRAAALDDGDRRVDDERLAGAAHEQRVARRVGAVGVADEHADRRRSADARRHPSRWSPRGRYLPSRHLVDVSPGRQMAAPIGRIVPRESRRGRLRQRREPS